MEVGEHEERSTNGTQRPLHWTIITGAYLGNPSTLSPVCKGTEWRTTVGGAGEASYIPYAWASGRGVADYKGRRGGRGNLP